MKPLAALALLPFLSSTLAEGPAPPSTCITITTQPTITLHSCYGDSSATTAIASPPHAASWPPHAHDPGTDSGPDHDSSGSNPSPSSGGTPGSKPNNPIKKPGSSGGSADHNPNAHESNTSPPMAGITNSAHSPDNTNEPETVHVAGAHSIRNDVVILCVAGLIPVIMGWL